MHFVTTGESGCSFGLHVGRLETWLCADFELGMYEVDLKIEVGREKSLAYFSAGLVGPCTTGGKKVYRDSLSEKYICENHGVLKIEHQCYDGR